MRSLALPFPGSQDGAGEREAEGVGGGYAHVARRLRTSGQFVGSGPRFALMVGMSRTGPAPSVCLGSPTRALLRGRSLGPFGSLKPLLYRWMRGEPVQWGSFAKVAAALGCSEEAALEAWKAVRETVTSR